MDQNINIVGHVSSLLDTEKYKEALTVPVEENYAKQFKDNCWDLIAVIVAKIDDDTNTLRPSLYGTCEQLLSIIEQSAVPEEALLEFIEQIELSRNDAQFSIILEPLQQLLLKLTVKKVRSLEWCLNAICTYIDAIPIPEYQLDGIERILLECDDNIRRITKVYSLLPPFYSPFLKEIAMKDANNRQKQIVTAFLISLLGKPLIYADVDPESNKNSEARQCTSILINDICLLLKNPLKFLDFIEICGNTNERKVKKNILDDLEEIQPYEHREKINETTLAGLFYVIFSGHFQLPDSAIPLVYAPQYLVNTVLLSAIHLLNFRDYGPVSKGVILCKEILKYCPDNNISSDSIKTGLLTYIHYDLCRSLMDISIFCAFETLRKEALSLISIHNCKFDYKGRVSLIRFMVDKGDHSGMMGYSITLYKNALDAAFKETKLPACFANVQLHAMLDRFCYLPHGAESDLVELADQIITSLNFLRYLALKDRGNITKIRNYFDNIERDYLEPLRTGLNMSKAHYEVKLKDIEEHKKNPEKIVKKTRKERISINVGGNILDDIPDQNKKEMILSALNAFHLIEGLIARLCECINMNKNN